MTLTGFRARICVLGALALLSAGAVNRAAAQDAAIYVLDMHQGSALTATVEAASYGGYYLQDHVTWKSFGPWYATHWHELSIDMMTQLGPDFGILWSLSSGERGEKYSIDPSFGLGILTQIHPKPNQTLSLRVGTILGGHLQEYPCQGDFGDIGGGIQPVNCRLAAGTLPADETLNYLFNQNPSRLSLTVSFRASF